MGKVWLQSPQGNVREYDTEKYVIGAMIHDGWKRAKRPEPGAMRLLPGAVSMAGQWAGGAMGGPPGAVVGGGIGGGIGELARIGGGALIGSEVPDTPQEVMGSVGREAAWGAGGTLAGLGLAKAAGGAGNLLMRGALRSPTAGPAEAALREGAVMTRGGVGTVERAIGRVADRTMDIVKRHNNTVYEPARLISRSSQDLLDKLAKNRTPAAREAEKRVMELMDDFAQNNKGHWRAEQLQRFKKDADAAAAKLWEATEGGKRATLAQNIEMEWHREAADLARAHLVADIPSEAGRRALIKANEEAAELIRLKNLMRPARKAGSLGGAVAVRGASAGVGAAGGYLASGRDPRGAMGGAVAGAAGASPVLLSGLAHMLNNPGLQHLLLNLPKVAAPLGTEPYQGGQP